MGTLAAGIKEIFATAKTTGSNVMLCGNDGTPDGHMTMANLASVLGVPYTITNDGINFNSLQNGTYVIIGGTSSNAPNNDSAIRGYVIQYDHHSLYKAQHVFDTKNMVIWYRLSNASGWDSWHTISADYPSFYKNYNSLVSLAGAMGANYAYPALTSAADFNNYTHTGVVLVYTVAIQAGIQNAPTGIDYGYLEILSVSNTDGRIRQRYYSWGAKSYMAYRFYENESWSSWRYD